MEGILRGILNTTIYIDDILVHSDTHEKTSGGVRKSPHEATAKSPENQFGKVCLQKQRGILSQVHPYSRGNQAQKSKLKAIEQAKPLTDVKTIQSFVGLCNFFRTHIKDFAIIMVPLFRLTRKDSG
jgi:hypothetical protein